MAVVQLKVEKTPCPELVKFLILCPVSPTFVYPLTTRQRFAHFQTLLLNSINTDSLLLEDIRTNTMNISKSVTRSLLTRQSLRCSHQSGRLLFTKTLLFSPSKVNTLEKYLAFRFTRSFSATVGVRSTSLDDDYKIDEISSSEFHTIADETLENILTHCEDLADTKPQIDIELAV